MEKTPSPFSPLLSRRVSLCPAHEWVLRSPPLSIRSVSLPLASLIPRSVFISPSHSASVGSFLDSPFYILPTLRPRYLNPRRPARHSGGPQHQPVGSRPCVASLRFVPFRFVSSLILFLCTSMHRIARGYASPKLASFAYSRPRFLGASS